MNDASTSSITGFGRLGSLCAGLAVISLGNTACGDDLQQRDLGNTETRLAAAEETGADRSPVIIDGRLDPFLTGHWIGHAEDPFSPSGPDGERPTYTFPSGSTEITLDLAVGEDGQYSAQPSLTFGAGPAPAPLRNVSYPPGFDTSNLPVAGSRGEIPLVPVEGFRYQLAEDISRTTDDRGIAAGVLNLGYLPNEPYDLWCRLQPPNEVDPQIFDCVQPTHDPNARCVVGNPENDSDATRVDCDVLNLCHASNVCSCTESGCFAAPNTAHQLWLVREGENLLGSFVGSVFDYGATPPRAMPVGTVRFERASE